MDEANQRNKQHVWNFWGSLAGAWSADAPSIIAQHMHADVVWNGSQPFNRLEGREALYEGFWRPLFASFPDLERKTYIIMGGRFAQNDTEWVAGTGHLAGTFAADWLDIPATGRRAAIRFGEFCRIVDGAIAEVYVLFDWLDLMRQAGYLILPMSAGDPGFIPAPLAGDGVLLDPQDPDVTRESLELVEAMIFKGLSVFDQRDLDSMHMDRFWSPDMRWYGPCGIGSTQGLSAFQTCHQRPFLNAFPDRRGGNHKARFADGNYVASTGFPSIYATHMANWLGCPASNKPITMRVMDFWKREGDVLTENWVFIDIPDVFLQEGVDLFRRLREMRGMSVPPFMPPRQKSGRPGRGTRKR